MQHGTSAGYNHGCRCAECTEAHRQRHIRLRRDLAQRSKAGDPEVPHGTTGGYKNWTCRCDACTDANNEASRRYYHMLKNPATETGNEPGNLCPQVPGNASGDTVETATGAG